jgi:hypothetical protein
MKLENRFTVPVPSARPGGAARRRAHRAVHAGSHLTKRDGDAFEGTGRRSRSAHQPHLRRQGALRLQGRGVARRGIDGSGKETRGTGTAKALITCRLLDRGDTTEVGGRHRPQRHRQAAQFGRGVLADVSSKLVDQFAACLAEEIAAGTPEPLFAATAAELGTPEGVEPPAAPTAPPPATREPAEAIDLLGTAGAPVLKRLAPVLGGLALLLLVLRRLRR